MATSFASSGSDVKPFTTLTIDIWGTGPGSDNDSDGSHSGHEAGTVTSDAGDGSDHSATATSDPDATAPDYTGPAHVSHGSPAGTNDQTALPTGTGPSGSAGGIPDGQAESTQDSSGVTAGSDGPVYGTAGESDQKGSTTLPWSTGGGQSPGGSSSWYTVVTDSDVHWTTGSAGPTQVTVLSPHTFTFGGRPTDAPAGDSTSPSSITVLGPDGKPTIVEVPGGASGGQPTDAPADTYVSPSSITIFGQDGKPTIVEMPGGISGANPFPTSGVFPGGDGSERITTGVTVAPASVTAGDGSAPGGDGQAGVTTCASITVLGADGLPTVLHTTWVVPSAAVSGPFTGFPFPNSVPTAIPSIPQATPGAPDGAGVTTCTSYTVIGPDGVPTVVEST